MASIYYEHGKSRIDERKSPGLKQLIEILKDHSHVVIEIGAHTDATGPSKYNKELSEQRALSVKRYLEKNGVTATRLVSKGYGEDKILNRCKEGVRCSSSEHAQNRRTEFKVVAQKGFKVGEVKEAWLNYTEIEKPTLGTIFFVWYYKSYIPNIYIDNKNSISTVAGENGSYSWIHSMKEVEKKKKKKK